MSSTLIGDGAIERAKRLLLGVGIRYVKLNPWNWHVLPKLVQADRPSTEELHPWKYIRGTRSVELARDDLARLGLLEKRSDERSNRRCTIDRAKSLLKEMRGKICGARSVKGDQICGARSVELGLQQRTLESPWRLALTNGMWIIARMKA